MLLKYGCRVIYVRAAVFCWRTEPGPGPGPRAAVALAARGNVLVGGVPGESAAHFSRLPGLNHIVVPPRAAPTAPTGYCSVSGGASCQGPSVPAITE